MEKKPRLSKQEKKAAKSERIKEKRSEKRKTAKRKPRKKQPEDQQPPKYHVCFEVVGGRELMSEKEMNSLALQIRYAYGENRLSPNPVNLSVTNFSLIRDYFPKEHPNWTNFTAVDESVSQVTDRPVVVLSADATDTLTHLDEETVYVIGGLVDRNRHKGCVEKRFGGVFPTAKLPISQALTSSTVLSSLHVFQILAAYLKTQDWSASTQKYIPERKQARPLTAAPEEVGPAPSQPQDS